MLPFPTMNKYGNTVIRDKTYEINLDFTRQVLGDNNVIDFSTNNHIFTKVNSSPASVVYDSTLNKNVMYFNGGVFSTPMTNSLKLASKNFEFDVMYKRNSSINSIQVLYGTGYYPDVPNNIPGIAHQIMQYDGMDQYFAQNSTSYVRQLIPSMSNTAWQRLVYRKDINGVTMTRYINNAKVNEVTTTALNIDNGTAFGIGGYYKTPSSWNFYGYIKYLTLKIF